MESSQDRAELTFYNTTSGDTTNSRNWGFTTNLNQYGDFQILRSTTNAGAPNTTVVAFDKNGLVGIGTAVPNQGQVEVKGGSVCVDTDSDDNATSCIANESDERLKENITAISASSSLDVVLALNPVSFDWRANDPEVLSHYPLLGRYAGNEHSIGLIAQEVMPVLPEALSLETVGDDEVQYFQLDYTKFIPHLIGAVKEIASISGKFREALTQWLASAENGIVDLFAKNLHAENVFADHGTFGTLNASSTISDTGTFGKLCAQKSDGSQVCVTGDELSSLLSGSVLGASTQEEPTEKGTGAAAAGAGAPMALPAQGDGGPPALEAPNADTATTTTPTENEPAAGSLDGESAEPAAVPPPEAGAGDAEVSTLLEDSAEAVPTNAANDSPQPQVAEQSSHDGNDPVVELPATGTE